MTEMMKVGRVDVNAVNIVSGGLGGDLCDFVRVSACGREFKGAVLPLECRTQ